MVNDDLVVRIGGEGGDGIISMGEILSRAVVRGGLNIHAYRTFPAEIRGGLAMFQLRAGSGPTLSLKQQVDVLLAFNQDAYNAYVQNVKGEGVLLFDPKLCQPDDRLGGRERADLPLEDLSRECTGDTRGKNMVALGALMFLHDVPVSYAHTLTKAFFARKGDEVVVKNIRAVDAGLAYAAQHLQKWQRHFRLQPDRDQILINGNEAVALGAIAAGCEFIGGYPITPATPVFEMLCKELPKFGGVAVQMEDEIASLASVIGASFTGKRAMTATSGPGLSLMSETLNLAAMAETPVVIINVQRAGPSTGMPTKTEQSDLKFAIYGTSGESPRCIIAPLSVEDAFYQTMRAFRIAERYQMPVIVLTDMCLAYSTNNIDRPDLAQFEQARRKRPEPGATSETFRRYAFTPNGVSPMPVPGEDDLIYMGTGLEHNEKGDPNYTPEMHMKMTEKRFLKLKTLGDAVMQLPVEEHMPEGAEIGVIGWGSTFGALQEAVEMLARKDGIHIAHLHPRVLSPLREWGIRRFLGPLKKIIVAEENFTGQYAHFLKGKFGIHPIEIHKYDGIPFTSEELYASLKEAI